ncbi:MAG: pitrilysin family protein [Dehalococcoidia bacterium]|nr:pitrilysin family protein [Dehalococcoidia bacterium]
MFQKTILDNGMAIVTSEMPHTRSVSVAIYIGVGSRYESEEQAGLSHFVEHMLFKGTESRPTAKEISDTIEGVGGVLNGGTDRELTVYWSKVARPHLGMAIDLLADMILRSRFDPAEVEKERKVVVEEINMVNDSPHQLVDVVIDEVVWPNQPLGRDVAGSKDTVTTFTRDMALGYLHSHYGPSNTVVSVAGNVTHEEVVDRLHKAFQDWPVIAPTTFSAAEDGQREPRLKVEQRKIEQAHVCLAVRGLSSQHPDRFILDVLNVILGEGMSSRLFLELREKQGLAYDVHSYVSHFLDCGAAVVYAGVDPLRIEATINAILEQLSRLKEGISEEEITRAKEFSKGRMLLRMEDTRSVSSWMGGQELLTGRILSIDDVVSIVDAVMPDDLRRMARQIYTTDKLNMAVVGPFKSQKRFAGLLRFGPDLRV